MNIMILTLIITLSTTLCVYAVQDNQIQIYIDNQNMKFDSPLINKNDAWLVPIDSFCKQLGLKVEYPDSEDMVVICDERNTDLCVPLFFGENAINIDGVSYAQPKIIIEQFGFETYKASETKLEVIRTEQLAPIFTLLDLDDTPRQLKDFRGKKTLLYIWGSW